MFGAGAGHGLLSFPPGVAQLELQARVHAGVLVAQRGGRDVFGVEGKVERAARTGEVVKADSRAGAEVENRSAAEDLDCRRKFVGGINHSSLSLKPWSEPS